ncbi:MAG: hypothetical protein JWP36_2507 [Paucimonas sp.]|nr:hypothetical protein [Paucimonas sp.]
MNIRKPNRMRTQFSDPHEAGLKVSGDQHSLPMDEPAEDPYRPHRVSRQDTHKALSPERANGGIAPAPEPES